jgi:uncharacterized protein
MQETYPIPLKENDYLFVQESQIPQAGKGLFTSIGLQVGDVIARFKGRIITNIEADKIIAANEDDYFVSMTDGTIMDSKHVKCFAKYANDVKGSANSPFKNNAFIGLNLKKQVCLIANCNISNEEEIFADYGKKYWRKRLK